MERHIGYHTVHKTLHVDGTQEDIVPMHASFVLYPYLLWDTSASVDTKQFPIPSELLPSDLLPPDLPLAEWEQHLTDLDPAAMCKDGLADPIATILNCIDVLTGSFTCHCSVVVESFKRIPQADDIANKLGLSSDFVERTTSCCPPQTSTLDFSKCMLDCDESPDEPTCQFLGCVHPLSGIISECKCERAAYALDLISAGGERAEALGITREMADAAVACCPSGTALEYFNECFNAVDHGLVLPCMGHNIVQVTEEEIDEDTRETGDGDQPSVAEEAGQTSPASSMLIGLIPLAITMTSILPTVS